MASTTLVPVKEFLKTIDERPPREYVDGVVIEKPMGSRLHGILQMWFGHLFARYPQYAAASEWHVRVRPTEYRLPDIAVQHRNVGSTEIYAETPLVLAIEILSPGDRIGATFAKCEIYHEWGVPFCWVVDPDKRRAWSYQSGDEPRLAVDALEAGDIRFTLAEVFEGLDPKH
ncbi:MAG TPA: Uma2 family endonuclease [Bryobacteraceae bacterium]|jgi:Uma2 family endonuclease|nr:Uma2 family endonuclease [Bryobacteraceae bacterium]